MFGIDDFLLATIGGAIIGQVGQSRTNDTNVELNRETRDWQERMSNTAYTRAVGDLKNAGLNPMLSLMHGGASTPGVSAPVIGNALGAGVASGQAAASTFQGIEAARQAKAMTEQIGAQTEKIRSETLSNTLNSAIAQANLRNMLSTGDRTAAEAESADVAAKSAHRGYEANVKYSAWEQDVLKRRAESGLAQLAELAQGQTFSADVARRKADSLVAQYDVPGAKAGATFAEDTGTLPKYLRVILDVLRGASSARSAMR